MRFNLPLEKMSVEDKLRALEEIWTDLAGTPEDIPSPSWHAKILHTREQRISEGKSKFLDLAEAKKAVQERIK